MNLSDKSRNFFKDVYQVVELIPYGKVTSYGAIAKFLGSARSSRMVGWARNAAHEMPHIPAHRVVNRVGLLTGKNHFDATKTMQERLEDEGISIKNNQIIDFKAHFWDPIIELDIEG